MASRSTDERRTAPQGSNLAAVQEEEEIDPWSINTWYDLLGDKIPINIDENVIRKVEIRRQWTVVATRIADRSESDAVGEFRYEAGPCCNS